LLYVSLKNVIYSSAVQGAYNENMFLSLKFASFGEKYGIAYQ